MRALRSHAPGGPETLTLDEVDEPVPGPGEVLIAVRAAAINFPDSLIIQDLYQFRPQRPFSPGAELAGVVEAVGPGVTAWQRGDRVFGMMLYGALAEKVVMPAARVFALPDSVTFDSGAALLMTYGTAIHALLDRGRLQPGDTLLVLGAAGGVGLAAVELGKALGARVIAAVSSEAKAQAARDAGADDAVVYPHAPFGREDSKALSEAFKAACGPDGAQVILDCVGGDYSEPALRAIALQGRFLVVGFPAGIARMPLNLTLLKACYVCGVFYGSFLEREP
ncbi:MAG: NADPH:quinone oxidoreductase family protein, partial [Sphingomonadales bacterium]|nr:NADPH:quinone oxidoreductase family protein [Sphingomonadales bacterium]